MVVVIAISLTEIAWHLQYYYSVWTAGQGWTVALELGHHVMVDKEWSHMDMEERENHFYIHRY